MPQEATTGSYATYEYYKENYMGTTLSMEEFNRNAKWASALVDQMTFGRVAELETIPDCVMDAICGAAESRASYLKKSELELKSESNDGYSVSYADAGSETDFMSSVRKDIRIYLANTGLLYRGTRKCGGRRCCCDY